MSSWFVLNLGDAMLAAEQLVDVQRRFEHAWRAAGCPPGMGLFGRHVSEGRLHCELWVYLSPAASALARELGAASCAAPSSSDLDLLAGTRTCIQQ